MAGQQRVVVGVVQRIGVHHGGGQVRDGVDEPVLGADRDRVGLDHLSFGVESRATLNEAIRTLDERGVPHGEVRELTDFGICVLPFRDPDNIQLEITSPL